MNTDAAISRLTTSVNKWDDLLKIEFEKESDRACVILGAALLDSALETLLKARLVPTSNSNDSLLDGSNAPISHFSSRIDLAHRIGLITSKMARDIHLVRRIRNDFAHNITGCSFEDTSVHARVMELTRSHGILDRNPQWSALHGGSTKNQFFLAVSWMQWYLRGITENTSSIESPEIEWGYTIAHEEEKD